MERRRLYRGLINVFVYLAIGLIEISRGHYVLGAIEIVGALNTAWFHWMRVAPLRAPIAKMVTLLSLVTLGAFVFSLLGLGFDYLKPLIGEGAMLAIYFGCALMWGILYVRQGNRVAKRTIPPAR